VFWGLLGLLAAMSGLASGNIVTVAFGTAMALAAASSYLTSYVKSDRRAKRALEVALALATPGVFAYAYALTRSIILAVATLLIVALVVFGFMASYLLPGIRSRLKRHAQTTSRI